LTIAGLDGAGAAPAFFLGAALDFIALCFFTGRFVAFFGDRLVLALEVFFFAARFFIFAIDPLLFQPHAR
jgi:hypothetical protein